MPTPVFHLWIAREYAKGRPDLYNNSDYYLGNIAPDAVYTRENYTTEWKNRTHLFTDRNTWEGDAMRSFRLIQEPTAFQTGYYMHILTDIQFRNKCREF